MIFERNIKCFIVILTKGHYFLPFLLISKAEKHAFRPYLTGSLKQKNSSLMQKFEALKGRISDSLICQIERIDSVRDRKLRFAFSPGGAESD